MGKELQGEILCIGEGEIVPYYNSSYHRWYVFNGNKSTLVDIFPTVDYYTKRRLPVIKDGKFSFFSAGLSSIGVEVRYYFRDRGEYRSNIEEEYRPDEGWASFANMKRLSSGNILTVWHEMIAKSYTAYPRFSFFEGNTYKTEWLNQSMGEKWVSSDFTELNGLIYYFGHKDSNDNICLITLDDSGIKNIVVDFCPDKTEFEPEGENPTIVARTVGDIILLAYQKYEYPPCFYSTDPPLKGAFIQVVKVYPDLYKEIVYISKHRTERETPFVLLDDSIIYCPINEETLEWNEWWREWFDGRIEFVGDAYRQRSFYHSADTFWYNQSDGTIKEYRI